MYIELGNDLLRCPVLHGIGHQIRHVRIWPPMASSHLAARKGSSGYLNSRISQGHIYIYMNITCSNMYAIYK